MSLLTSIKLGAAIIGVVLVGWGMRVDDPRLRWVGIGFLAVAWLTRFGKPRQTPPDDSQRA